MIVQENGRYYQIDEETGLVTEAKAEDLPEGAEVISADDLQEEFRIGDRVEADGALGEIVSITSSVYGPAFGVRFDDGGVDEYPEMALKRSAVEKPDFETPVDEVLQRFEAYQNMPALTNDEIDRKEKEARWLNLRARALCTDSKLAFSSQNDLHHVVLVTREDLNDIDTLREQSADNQEYVASFNRYKVASEFSGYGGALGMKGDASWLDNALEGMEVVETTDTNLAARATEVVASLSREQLENDETVQIAASYQRDYLQLDDDQARKFSSYLESARQERLKEPQEKVASTTDESLDDFRPESLYL